MQRLNLALLLTLLLSVPSFGQTLPTFWSGLSKPVCSAIAIEQTSPEVGDTLTVDSTWVGHPFEVRTEWYVNDVLAYTGESFNTTGVTEADDVVYVTETGLNAAGSATRTSASVIITSEDLPEGSLRPSGVFGAIPSEATAAGFAPNDLSTSVRTDVTPTTRGGVIEITGGTYTEPYTCGTSNRTYRLMGDVTFSGCGLRITASNVTIDLNGHTLTYKNVAPEAVETGTISSSGGGGGTAYPTIDPTGLTLANNSHYAFVVEFTSGAESGNHYCVASNTGTTLTLENDCNVSDDASVVQSWQDGGPSNGDTFRIYDPTKTFGVGVARGSYPGDVEVVNGSIIEGDGYGRGSIRIYCSGCSPLQYLDGGAKWEVGGVYVEWHAGNACGINIKGSTNAVVKYCEINDTGTLVTNRQRGPTTVATNSGSTIQYNRVMGHRQGGIRLSDNSTAEYNEIYGDSHATNSTGIGCFSKSGITIRYNNVYKVGQHPVCIGIAQDSNNNQVYGNWCEAQTTRKSPEYGYNLACGLTSRWGNRPLGPNIYHDNAFIVYAEDGSIDPDDPTEDVRGRSLFLAEVNVYRGVSGTTGGGNPDPLTMLASGGTLPTRTTNSHQGWKIVFAGESTEDGNIYRVVSNTSTQFSLERDTNDADPSVARTWKSGTAPTSDGFYLYDPNTIGGEEFYDNFFGAYSRDDTAEVHCAGPMMSQPSTVLHDNTFVSTHNHLWFNDSYSPSVFGVRYINNTFIKAGSDANFKTIRVGTYYPVMQDLISNTFNSGTASDDIGGSGSDAQTTLRYGYNLTVTVTDGGSPVEGASVTVYDKDGETLRMNYLTDSDGEVVVDVPTYYRQGPTLSTTHTLNPLTVEATSGDLTGSNTISPTSDDTITVAIE